MKRICEKLVRRTILSLFIVFLAMVSFSATYYVSNTGNDSNSGLSSPLSWKTLSKVNSATYSAGDQILFQRGNTFYGSLTILNSGTSGSRITYGAYGSGANPDITGFTTVNSWTSIGSNIWESAGVVSTLSSCNMVTVVGVVTPMGRIPNTGFYSFQSHSGSSSVTSSSLSGTPNWTGAKVVIRTNPWIMNKVDVSSQSGGTLNFTSSTNYEPINGYGFFIQNDVRTLDAQNEWYYNPTTKKIRIYSIFQPTDVNVSSVDVLATVHGSYVTIENISFTGANTDAIYNQTGDIYRNLVVKNCSIACSGSNGMKLKMLYLRAENNSISNSNDNGILITQQVDTDSLYIRGNTVTNSGVNKGMFTDNSGAGLGGITIANKNNAIVEYNTVSNSGYCGISIGGGHGVVKNNFVDTFCSVLEDGGGIYTFSSSYHLITGNVILNGIGASQGTDISSGSCIGLYLDYGTNHAEISYNTIANCTGMGMFMNASDINVHHNTIYNNTKVQFLQYDAQGGIETVNNQFNYNTLVAKTASQLNAEFDYASIHTQSLGSLNNNCYARPIDDSYTIRLWLVDGAASNKSLEQWKAYTGQDAGSYKSTRTITDVNDLQFEYNETKTAKTIALSRPMTDVKGVKYSSSVTLQPFTSLVLIKK